MTLASRSPTVPQFSVRLESQQAQGLQSLSPWALGHFFLNPANSLAPQSRTGGSSDTDGSPHPHTPLYRETETLRSGAAKEFQVPPGHRISVSMCLGRREGGTEEGKEGGRGRERDHLSVTLRQE